MSLPPSNGDVKPRVRTVSPFLRYQSAERCRLPHEKPQPLPTVRDARIVLGVTACNWLLLALATFNPADSSYFNVVLPAVPVTNWCGMWGAHSAAWLFVVFGHAAWAVVLLLLNAVFPRDGMRIQRRIMQMISGGSIVVAVATLGSLLSKNVLAGGMVGKAVCSSIAGLGVAGGVLLSLTLLFFSVLVFTRCSIVTVIDRAKLVYSTLMHGVGAVWYLLSTAVSYLWPRASAPTDTAYTFTTSGAEKSAPKQPSLPKEHLIEIPLPEPEPASITIAEIVTDAARSPIDRRPEPPCPGDLQIHEIAEAQAPAPASCAPADEQELATQSPEDEDEEEQLFADETDSDDDDDDDDEDKGGSDSGSSEGKPRDIFTYHGATEEAPQSDEDDEGPAVYTEPAFFALPQLETIFDAKRGIVHDAAMIALCQERARTLEEKLMHFGVEGRVCTIKPGPVVTLYEYEPEVGSKVSKILSLEDDLALSLKALSIRILAPIPGTSVVGFEIANERRMPVLFADVLDGLAASTAHLPLALGVDITGKPVIGDLAAMPHLLVAGATGAGKSVGMNVMLTSLLARVSPDHARIVLIDPKRLEFTPYAGIPHLLFPIITNPSEVAPVLKWVAQEMELRYEVMARVGVRNIAEYHRLSPVDCFAKEREVGLHVHRMPYMVIMIDELADLIMVGGREIEMLIARIAQMARAAGIHMLVATQRPSVDVVTGLIKANFPSRIAFRVSSKIDSRTIIDSSGAERLLGKGDMLYMTPSSMGGLQRLHGAYVTDTEIDRLTTYLKEERSASYFSLKQVVAQHAEEADDYDDPLYGEVCDFVNSIDEISISLLQRKYRVGFNRSARLIEMLERDGYIAAAQGGKPRRVLRE